MSADISDGPGTRRGGGISLVPAPRVERPSVPASPRTFTTVHGFARSTSGASSLDVHPAATGSPAQPANLDHLEEPSTSQSVAASAPPQLSNLSTALRQSLRAGPSGDLAHTMQQVRSPVSIVLRALRHRDCAAHVADGAH